MDELEISGKRYISTRRAAREHGYHSDYMGQLIRGKKVAGQKVGRAWYIEEDSLNVYLGKAPAPAPVQTEAPASAVEAVPVERLFVEEQAPAPEPAAEVAAEISKEKEIEAGAVPAAQIKHTIVEPVQIQPAQREIHHTPYIKEEETRIPIHTVPMPASELGGLRYAPDDSPSMPVVMRMPQTDTYTPMQAAYAPAPHHSGGKFPFVSLFILAAVVILSATFVSNFVTVSIVSEEGKAATVQYAIHW